MRCQEQESRQVQHTKVKLRYKDCFLFKMRHTELHSTATLLCQTETMGPGTREHDQGPGTGDQGPMTRDRWPGNRDRWSGNRDQWTRNSDQGHGTVTRDQEPGQDCEFVRLRNGVHEVAVLLGFDASPDPRRRATTGTRFFTPYRTVVRLLYNVQGCWCP